MPAKRIFLNGIDYFQLLIDHHNKRYGGPGHEARLAIFLEGVVDEQVVKDAFLNYEHSHQLIATRVAKSVVVGYPYLFFSEENAVLPVSFHYLTGNEIPQTLLNTPVDVYNHPPFRLDVLYFENRNTCLLFSFHHILFDFAGVQAFIYSLAGIKKAKLLPTLRTAGSPAKRFRRFFRAVFFTFREANRNMTVPGKPLPGDKHLKIVYRELEFTPDETKRVYENFDKLGVGMNKSVAEVAAVSKAMHDVIFSKQAQHNFIWAPAPVNIRRKGSVDALYGNGLSFLFYKLRPADLVSFEKTVGAVRNQMLSQMRVEMPAAMIDFMQGYRFMPLPFYYPMMKLPSWGKLSSFSYSTLGTTFNELETFMGHRVITVKNYPSNSIKPGVTFLFYEYRNRLTLMTSWVEGQYSSQEQQAVLFAVKQLSLKGN